MNKQMTVCAMTCAGLLLAACSLPPAPPPAVKNASAAGEPAMAAQPITADQVSLSPQGLWESWKAEDVPATPYDASQPPGPTGLPAHVVVTFNGQDASALTPGDPALYLIPVLAYEKLWNDAGNPAVSRMMQSIFSSTIALQSPPPVSGLPALPFEQVGGGVNDLAVQQGRVAVVPESASKSGFRFVGRWAQSPNPVTNQNLRYVYQGFTNDGQYLVAFFSPISAPALPATASDVPAEQMSAFNSDPTAYMAAQADVLNQLAPSEWQPGIDQLSAVVASLGIAGMQTHGLLGPTWKLVAQRNGGQEEALGNPENYTVTYNADGTLAVQADCNRIAGAYTAEGGAIGSLRTQLGPSTMAACGPDSHAELLVNVLASAQNYRVKPGGATLELIQPAGGTVLVFAR